MKVFYFTATGNCLEVAKAIGGELLSIPQVLRKGPVSFTDDAIGIVFPCYALGVPPIVQDFMQKIKLNSPYIFGVMTYGNFEGGGVHHFNSVAIRNGITLSYVNSILMVDNYLNFFAMEDQLATYADKKVAENLAIISQEVNSGRKFTREVGFLMKGITWFAQLFNPFKPGNNDKNFIVEDHCNGCKVCEKVCPMNNIEVRQKPEFGHRCIGCYACTHNCPQNAIRLNGEKSKARFRNSQVELKEIIEANS